MRYKCGVVDYNQPCTRKYTVTPRGKVREIGKFKYTEKDGELLDFEYDGKCVPLELYTFDQFLRRLSDDSGCRLISLSAPIIRVIPGKAENAVSDIVVTEEAPVHAVNITAHVECIKDVPETNADDEWMDENGNDPVGIDMGVAAGDVHVEAHVVDPVDPPKEPENAPPKKKAAPVNDRWGSAIREVTMTAAAREAATACGLEGIPDEDTSVDIVRACYSMQGFMDKYGEYLKKAGSPRTLEELADALPGQREWIMK